MGVSFAIPMDIAQNVIEQLKSKGSVSRGWLGVYVQEIDTALAESFGMSKPTGALVAQVMPDGPAAEVLKQGDVILSVDGKPVDNSAALPLLVSSTPIGKVVALAVLRAGKPKTVTLTLTELPSPPETERITKIKANARE